MFILHFYERYVITFRKLYINNAFLGSMSPIPYWNWEQIRSSEWKWSTAYHHVEDDDGGGDGICM